MISIARISASASLALGLWVSASTAIAAEPTPSVEANAASRYRLTSSTSELTQSSDRYTVRARFAPLESSGELREGGGFTLIGRFAKASASCDANTLFKNGFES